MSRRLDELFSRYIRLRDQGRGCISCGCHIAYNNCDAGHYISRAHLATRWHPLNVNGQCRHCNRFLDGNIEAYRKGLIKRYGIEVVEELERLKHTTAKFSEAEIKLLTKKYRELNKSNNN